MGVSRDFGWFLGFWSGFRWTMGSTASELDPPSAIRQMVVRMGCQHGPVHCAICGFPEESVDHILFLCPISKVIWGFYLNNADTHLSNISLSQTFTLQHCFKFESNKKGWNTLILATIWNIWWNRNSVSFCNNRRDISSIFYDIMSLTIF